ncbi:UDP-N-acetylglucosamine 1-carboxyvinyltransferase [Tropheryma whipplei]|uniref:UDP-N-acetylglucosamine 1-carboxyvinyltransferase n=1 Tax=Tropheryma whipplei TaxID=2039 RepID=UPI0004BA1E74|nr:UDP-N-acetylglucosamine 1-carboxyvinyltransferase [Tropheryma whipplei]
MKLDSTPDRFVITGGSPLRGEIAVKGAKNLVTKAMVASMLGNSQSVLTNVPNISDVLIVRRLMEAYNVSVRATQNDTLVIDPILLGQCSRGDIDVYAGSSRVPILFCGPLLHKTGQAFITGLGGCRIGERPIDFHLQALRKFGASHEKLPGGILLSTKKRLKGASVHFPYPSVGATEQVLLTAVLADGVTELRGAAIEPEIMDLIAILQKMGAIITCARDRVILIEGVDSLSGYTHHAISDRNEAASWACAALATRGDIFVRNAEQAHLLAFLSVYRKVGGVFEIKDDGIRFFHPGGNLNPVVVETDVHPGFSTDWQQPLVVALTQASGRSVVHETVYESRFGFTEALNRMGADISVHENGFQGTLRRVPHRAIEQAAVINGPTPLTGQDIDVPDLRGGFSHFIAAFAAEGKSIITNAGIISRGYENFVHKLERLKVDFEA